MEDRGWRMAKGKMTDARYWMLGGRDIALSRMRDPRTAQAVRPYHAALSDAMRHNPTQPMNASLHGYMVTTSARALKNFYFFRPFIRDKPRQGATTCHNPRQINVTSRDKPTAKRHELLRKPARPARMGIEKSPTRNSEVRTRNPRRASRI